MNNILNINSNSTTLLENNSKPNQDKNTDEQTNGNKRVSKTISNNSNCSSESSGIGSINNNQPSNDESNINAEDKELAQIAVENTNKIEKINPILKYKSNNKLNIQNRSTKILHPKKEFKLKLHFVNKNQLSKHYINKLQAKNKQKHQKMLGLNNADDDNNDDSMNEAENKLETTNNDYDEEHVAKKIKFSNVNPKKRKLNSSSPIISKQASASFQNELDDDDDDDDDAADFGDEAETDDENDMNDYQDISGESDEQDDFYNDEIEQFEDLDESCADNESRNANNEYFSSDGLVDSVKKSKLKKDKYESSYLFRAMSEILTCQLALTRKVDQVRDNFFMIDRRLKLIEANLKRSSKLTNRSMLGSSENILNENNKTTGLSSIQPRRMQFDDISNDEEPEDSSSCKKIKDDSNLIKKEKSSSSTNEFERNNNNNTNNNIAKSTSSTSPQSISISPLAKHKQYLASMDNVNKNDTNEMISSHKPKLNESIHSAINNALATAAAAASPPTNFQINDQYLRQQMAQKQLMPQHPNEKLIRKSNLAKCNSAPPPLSQTASGLKSAIQAQTPFQASTSTLQQTIPASAASPNFHRRLVASNSAKFAHENKPSITPSLQSHNLLNHNFQTHSNYQRIQQTSQQSQQHHHHHPHHLSQQQAASQNHSSYFVHGSNNPFSSSSHSHSSPGSQMHPSYTSTSNHMNHQSTSSSSLQSSLAHPMHLKQSLHSQLAHSNSSSAYHQNLGLLKSSNQTSNTNSSAVLAAAISAAMASSSNLAASGSNSNFSALPLVESLVQQHQANDYQLDNSNNNSSGNNNNNFNNSSYSAYDDHDYESDDEANYQTDHPSSFIGNSLVQHGPIRHVPSNAVDQLSLSEEAEALVSRDIIKKCIRKAKHRGNFAANLAAELFSKEERITCNCTGTRGKRQLSPRRLNIVKEITYRMYNGNTNTVAILAASGSSAAAAAAAAAHQDFEEAWRKECITAIDAKNRRYFVAFCKILMN